MGGVSRLRGTRRIEGLHPGSAVSACCHAEDGSTLCSVSGNQLRVFCPHRQRLVRASSAGELQLSSCLQLLGVDLIAMGSWDQRIHIYSVGRGKVVETRLFHDDAVSALDGAPSTCAACVCCSRARP